MATLNLQELTIRKTAVQVNVAEKIVELVIAHKSKAIFEALSLYTSVEDSGLGKLSIRPKVVIKELDKLDKKQKAIEALMAKEGITEKELNRHKKVLTNVADQREYLNTKI